MEVELLQWPQEDARREALRSEGRPRLLLVAEDDDPPLTVDCLEDWTRGTAGDSEVRARIEALTLRRQAHLLPLRLPDDAGAGSSALPLLDCDGVIRYGGGWAALPPLEARITEALVERFGAVAGREALLRAGWARDTPSRNALDVHVLRLRRRLAPLGLAIRTIRSRGYLMEPLGPSGLQSVPTGSSGRKSGAAGPSGSEGGAARRAPRSAGGRTNGSVGNGADNGAHRVFQTVS